MTDFIRETRDAIDALVGEDQALCGSWRARVRELAGVDVADPLSLRTMRATLAAAAVDAASAVRFEGHLLRQSPARLGASRAAFESWTIASRTTRDEAAAQLRRGLRATARADDVATLVWDFADRIEQLLVGLSEAAYEAFGEHPGGLVPPRGLSDAAWLIALPERIMAGDANVSPAEIAARSDAVDGRVDEGIATIAGCADRAGLRLSDGEPQIAARTRALAARARRFDRLAESMEWLATVPGRPGVVRRA